MLPPHTHLRVCTRGRRRARRLQATWPWPREAASSSRHTGGATSPLPVIRRHTGWPTSSLPAIHTFRRRRIEIRYLPAWSTDKKKTAPRRNAERRWNLVPLLKSRQEKCSITVETRQEKCHDLSKTPLSIMMRRMLLCPATISNLFFLYCFFPCNMQ